MAIAIYILIILMSVTQVAMTKFFNISNEKSSPLSFNALKSVAALALFLVYTLLTSGVDFHVPTLLYGAFYGLSLCISLYSGYKALCLGPMALTSMLVSFSIVIPLIWSVSVGNETVNALKAVALVFLFVSMITVNADKFKHGTKTPSNYPKWIAFVLLTFATNGICSVLQKEYSNAYPSGENGEFMVSAMLLCAIVYVIALIVKTPISEYKKVKGKWYAVLSGVTNSIANFLTLALAGLENATVLFPVISAGTILASLLCGRFVFKEKLRINHYVALLFGTAAVVLLKL